MKHLQQLFKNYLLTPMICVTKSLDTSTIVEKSWEHPSTLSSMRRDTYDVSIVNPMNPYSSTGLNTAYPWHRNTSCPDHDHMSCPNRERANLSALTRLVKIFTVGQANSAGLSSTHLKIRRSRDSTHWYSIREGVWQISCTIYFQENSDQKKMTLDLTPVLHE